MQQYSVTLENKMFGYERAKKTLIVEAESIEEAFDKARKEYNDCYADIIEWRVI